MNAKRRKYDRDLVGEAQAALREWGFWVRWVQMEEPDFFHSLSRSNFRISDYRVLQVDFLIEAIKTQSRNHFQVISLAYIRQMFNSEIATHLGRDPKTVAMLRHEGDAWVAGGLSILEMTAFDISMPIQ